MINLTMLERRDMLEMTSYAILYLLRNLFVLPKMVLLTSKLRVLLMLTKILRRYYTIFSFCEIEC